MKKMGAGNERTAYFIKPEGKENRLAIRESIRFKTGLTISVYANVRITGGVVEKFYPEMPWNVQTVAEVFLVGQTCEVGIVEGEDAVNKLRKVCGVSDNPRECAPESIRGRFAPRMPIRAGKDFYWRDVIYFSKNKKDALRDLELARKLLNEMEP